MGRPRRIISIFAKTSFYMAQSLSKILIHVVFHKKRSSPEIRQADRSQLYVYLSKLLEQESCNAIIVNGVADHVHCLIALERTAGNIANVIGSIKRKSSMWLKTISSYYKDFYWQGGYGVFSIAHKDLQVLFQYILNQEKHHMAVSTYDEMIRLCRKNGAEADPNQLLID